MPSTKEKLPTIQHRLRNDAIYDTPEFIYMLSQAADHIDDLEARLYRMPDLTEAQAFAVIMQALAAAGNSGVSPFAMRKQAKRAKEAVDQLKIYIKNLKEVK